MTRILIVDDEEVLVKGLEEIIHLHGGTISVTSVPSLGSQFTIALPASK